MSRAKDRALKSAKEARGGGAFLPFRIDVLRSQAVAGLSPYAAKLLLDIASQWQLGRNGDASTAFEKVLRARGWRSKATLHNALKELRESGLIVQTRQGSLHQCSLYALGWLAIDECGGKLDVQPTTRPLNHWLGPIKPLENKASSTPRVNIAPVFGFRMVRLLYTSIDLPSLYRNLRRSLQQAARHRLLKSSSKIRGNRMIKKSKNKVPAEVVESPEARGAQMALQPSINAAAVIQAYTGAMFGKEPDINVLIDGLRDSFKVVKDGDLANLEAMLVGQATALQSLFTSLARRA